MNAYKCDRCGAYFDTLLEHQRIGYPIYAVSFKNHFLGEYHNMDLCFDCYQKLENWLEDGKETSDEEMLREDSEAE